MPRAASLRSANAGVSPAFLLWAVSAGPCVYSAAAVAVGYGPQQRQGSWAVVQPPCSGGGSGVLLLCLLLSHYQPGNTEVAQLIPQPPCLL
jgi:hypothetical protein